MKNILEYSHYIFNSDIPKRRYGYVNYMQHLKDIGLFEELYWELYEARQLASRTPVTKLKYTIIEWVDKLQNHYELLSDAEKEWVKNNPEYKEIIE